MRRYHFTCCDFEPAILGESPVLSLFHKGGGGRTDTVKLGMWSFWHCVLIAFRPRTMPQVTASGIFSITC